VADGAVRDFDGDLEDYAGWLEKRAPAPMKNGATTPDAPKVRQPGQPKGRQEGQTKPKDGRRKGAEQVKTIETSLAKLGQERARLEAELAAVDYARNADHARKVTERHAAVLHEVEQLETRWLELSERLESG